MVANVELIDIKQVKKTCIKDHFMRFVNTRRSIKIILVDASRIACPFRLALPLQEFIIMNN